MFARTFNAKNRLIALTALLIPALAAAQEPSPKPSPKPTPDAPAIRLGATIFSDFTFVSAPKVRDSDGNLVKSSAFDVSRAYLTANGTLSSRVSFRVTADIRRLTSPASAASSLDGSATFRLKYAYGQIALDGFLPKGSWIRLGAQQTPLIDYEEGVYRYRFQGTQMVEREGFLSSSDFGLTTRVNLPKEYGDIHMGVYNGESYAKAEANDRKALQARATLRPLPKHAFLKGLRLTAFLDSDQYIKGAPRNRFALNALFEHKYLVLGADRITATDQVSSRAARVESSAFSVWARPRTTTGLEGLVRFDSYRPNDAVNARRKRTILGGAYWFKTQASVSAAILIDYERMTYAPIFGKPRESRIALHSLFAF